MGWQLIPFGVGWREFSKTVATGSFECANPRCKGRHQTSQPYQLRSARNWATVLYIPVLPLNTHGHYVRCQSCKSIYPASVIRSGLVAEPGDAVDASLPPPPTSSPPTPSTPPTPSSDELEAHFSLPSPPPPPLLLADDVYDDGRTVQRRSGVAPPLSGRHLELRLDDGTIMPAWELTVIGRSPEVPEKYAGAGIVILTDVSLTVSKTHAVIGLDSVGPWVIDLGSANGVVVERPGSEVRLDPGVRTGLGPADTVRLGDRTFNVVVVE